MHREKDEKETRSHFQAYKSKALVRSVNACTSSLKAFPVSIIVEATSANEQCD